MSTITAARLLRLPDVCELTGLSITSIYREAKRGLFPKPIKLTLRSSAWPEHEVGAVMAARIASRTDDEIRELVALLDEQRKQPAVAA